MSGTQHQVTNHGVTGVTNSTRSNDDAYDGWSGTVVGKITDASIHCGQMIRHS
jgi:hypothetical protein